MVALGDSKSFSRLISEKNKYLYNKLRIILFIRAILKKSL